MIGRRPVRPATHRPVCHFRRMGRAFRGVCARSDAATRLASLPARGSRNTLLAAVAAFLPVAICFSRSRGCYLPTLRPTRKLIPPAMSEERTVCDHRFASAEAAASKNPS